MELVVEAERLGRESAFRADLTKDNTSLMKLLYSGRMMEFYQCLLGEPVLHYDFTWLRVMSPGRGTRPHCDVVYMGRGTREKLLTAWTPADKRWIGANPVGHGRPGKRGRIC
jgi:hypothetical protein